MKRIPKYLKEVRVELSKVIWPKKDEVVKLTLTILLISIIIGAFIGLLDISFTKLLETVIAR